MYDVWHTAVYWNAKPLEFVQSQRGGLTAAAPTTTAAIYSSTLLCQGVFNISKNLFTIDCEWQNIRHAPGSYCSLAYCTYQVQYNRCKARRVQQLVKWQHGGSCLLLSNVPPDTTLAWNSEETTAWVWAAIYTMTRLHVPLCSALVYIVRLGCVDDDAPVTYSLTTFTYRLPTDAPLPRQ